MNKTQYFFFVAINALFLFLASCKGKTPEPTTEERMKKSWTAQSVTENGTSVYANGSGTRPGYSQFQLNLASPPSVTYRSVDGQTFTGTYSISGTTLTLTGLTPQPTGTNGTISFNISNLTDTGVTLTRTTADPKTGNSTNVYTLKTP